MTQQAAANVEEPVILTQEKEPLKHQQVKEPTFLLVHLKMIRNLLLRNLHTLSIIPCFCI